MQNKVDIPHWFGFYISSVIATFFMVNIAFLVSYIFYVVGKVTGNKHCIDCENFSVYLYLIQYKKKHRDEW